MKERGPSKNQTGQSLLEILIAITLVAIIAVIVIMFAQTGLRSTKVSGEKARLNEIAQETMELTRSIALQDWSNVCESGYPNCKTVAGTSYFPTVSGDTWQLATGTEVVTLDETAYTRSVVFEKICRDDAGAVATVTTSSCTVGIEDPSSRKVVVTVETSDAGKTTLINFVTRWGAARLDLTRGNNVFYQTDWVGGATSSQIIQGQSAGTTNLGANFETSTVGLDYLDPGVIWLDAQ